MNDAISSSVLCAFIRNYQAFQAHKFADFCSMLFWRMPKRHGTEPKVIWSYKVIRRFHVGVNHDPLTNIVVVNQGARDLSKTAAFGFERIAGICSCNGQRASKISHAAKCRNLRIRTSYAVSGFARWAFESSRRREDDSIDARGWRTGISSIQKPSRAVKPSGPTIMKTYTGYTQRILQN